MFTLIAYSRLGLVFLYPRKTLPNAPLLIGLTMLKSRMLGGLACEDDAACDWMINVFNEACQTTWEHQLTVESDKLVVNCSIFLKISESSAGLLTTVSLVQLVLSSLVSAISLAI